MTRVKNLEDLQNRWSFMCEGIEDDYIRNATMMVLENSANYMVDNELASNEAMTEILDEAAGNPNVSQADYQGEIGADVPRKGVANYVVPKVISGRQSMGRLLLLAVRTRWKTDRHK